LSVPLPKALNTRIHIHLTIHTHHLLVFLETRDSQSSSGPAHIGSFVYALPAPDNREPLSTVLYLREDTVETATRLAKILVKRCGKPVYLGCNMKFGNMGRGGDVEEEMEGVKAVVETVVAKV
ncbi:hypothetical protein EX30DRAFT_297687, partial [Ascodesmis nigricans]